MNYAWDMMIAVSRMEDDALKLRKLTCDGSMLKGHSINFEKCVDNTHEIKMVLGHMQECIRLAIELADRK